MDDAVRAGFELLPVRRKVGEYVPTLILNQRTGHTPELRAKLSLLKLLGQYDYVEIAVNKARNTIQLIPKEKQTAYARPVRSDLITNVLIGGGSALVNEFGCKLGVYEMTEPLVFKYAGKK